MFNAISWYTFFTAALLILGAYYFISTALLYHTEIKQWIVSRGTPSTSVKPTLADDAVMGKAEPEAIAMRLASIHAEEVIARAPDMDEPVDVTGPVNTSPLNQWQEVDKLLDDVRAVLQAVVETKSTREECTALMSTLLSRYAHLKETSHRESVAFYVLQLTRESLSYQLSLPEVLSWWDVQ